MVLLSMRRIAVPQFFVVVCIDLNPSIRSGQMTCAALGGPLDDGLSVRELATSKKSRSQKMRLALAALRNTKRDGIHIFYKNHLKSFMSFPSVSK
jgi:hypothetical protein